MVPVERDECRKQHPPITQLLVRVVLWRSNISLVLAIQTHTSETLTEATCIGTNEGDLKYLELKYTLDAQIEVLPFAVIVTELYELFNFSPTHTERNNTNPMTGPLSGTREG
jgi:hypothetical protein